tara:strand:+ start:54 stop:1283 length:1230 start_codon:yes stop_codon:yes gene_type:complete
MVIKVSPLAPKTLKKTYQIPGVCVASTHCGLKKNRKDDLVLIKFDKPSEIFSVFTKSKTPGAPIIWNKSIKKKGKVSAILVNSGNANVFNGTKGTMTVKKIVQNLSKTIGIDKKEIYLASTGVIGEPLDPNKIIKKIPYLLKNLSNNSKSWLKAANAIRTTDTFPKVYSDKLTVDNSKIFINGIAKGSGMIAPNMATMLSFIFTNAVISKKEFKTKFFKIVEKTFNSITVDNDTSTSDMVLLIFVKNKINPKLELNKKKEFFIKLENLMTKLSHFIVKDGEGASKFITIKVEGAKNYNDAKKLAFLIANSLLFKTAMAGSDSNWGRIIMALGKGTVPLDYKKISIKFGEFFVFNNEKNLSISNTSQINKYLRGNEIFISIKIGKQNGEAKVWTCDLTKDYISINADYRS